MFFVPKQHILQLTNTQASRQSTALPGSTDNMAFLEHVYELPSVHLLQDSIHHNPLTMNSSLAALGMPIPLEGLSESLSLLTSSLSIPYKCNRTDQDDRFLFIEEEELSQAKLIKESVEGNRILAGLAIIGSIIAMNFY
jgi:hypothetical protein